MLDPDVPTLAAMHWTTAIIGNKRTTSHESM
jgi:hypothetical protein